jgi:hypothetical protein
MVVMIVMVDFALLGSREIGLGREPLIDCHSWRYRQSRDFGASNADVTLMDITQAFPYALRILVILRSFRLGFLLIRYRFAVS